MAVGRFPTAFEFLQVFGREVHIDRAVVGYRDEAAVRVERENRAHFGVGEVFLDPLQKFSAPRNGFVVLDCRKSHRIFLDLCERHKIEVTLFSVKILSMRLGMSGLPLVRLSGSRIVRLLVVAGSGFNRFRCLSLRDLLDPIAQSFKHGGQNCRCVASHKLREVPHGVVFG